MRLPGETLEAQRLVYEETRGMRLVDRCDVWDEEAFSVFRIWYGPCRAGCATLIIQWMNDCWPECACEFYQAETLDRAAVFNPGDEIVIDGDRITWATYFEVFSEDYHGYVARRKEEINI